MARTAKKRPRKRAPKPPTSKHPEQGERLERARLMAGFTNAAEFARLVGISPNTVYRLERGDILPSVETLAAWAPATSTTTDALLGLAPPPRRLREARA